MGFLDVPSKLIADLWRWITQKLGCEMGHEAVTRWQSAKPSKQWINKHGYHMREARDFGDHSEHEKWIVLCLQCD